MPPWSTLLLGGIFFVGLLFLAILFNGYLFKIQNSLFNIQHSKMVNRRTTNNELAKAQRRKVCLLLPRIWRIGRIFKGFFVRFARSLLQLCAAQMSADFAFCYYSSLLYFIIELGFITSTIEIWIISTGRISILAKAQRRKSLFGFATDLTDWADF